MSKIIERIKVLPLWENEVEPEILSGGLSNQSFTVEDNGGKYVVRMGEDYPVHHVFRDHELMVAKAASKAGFAPEVVHSESGLMVVRFIDGRTYDGGDVSANIERIAELTKSFHNTMPNHVSGGARLFWVFHVIRDYARTLKAGNSRMIDQLPSYLELSEELEQAQVPLPLIFGHHDLLPANFIDDGKKIWLIDFEYGAYSTAMFDLAGIASNAELSSEQDELLLTSYFGKAPDKSLKKSYAAMKCASLLRESMWSMVSEIHLETPCVDFEAYTRENLERLETALETYRSL